MKTLTFEATIKAPRPLVWKTMLAPDTYKVWASVFGEGGYYEGAWDKGAKIKFLTPAGDGMVSEIAENTPDEYVSIRHVGMIEKGVEDTTSEKIRSWAPAYETYRLADVPGGCRVTVTIDTAPDWEQFMLDTWPKALASLKELCER